MFPFDAELADDYYLEHYADANITKYICSPKIPVRPDMRRKYAKLFPDRYSMVRCYVYQLGYLKRLYQAQHWSYMFSADFDLFVRIYLIVTGAISIVGVLGEFCSSH